MKKILGKHINLRLVNLEDAEFILNLRTKKGEFLSKTDIDVGKQIEWLKEYKKRESKNLEYYFIVESKESVRLGTIRVYEMDFEGKKFTFGSFIIDGEISPKYSALEAIVMTFNFAFNQLGFQICFFDCRKNNDHANAFYLRFGAKIINEDGLDFYYEYDDELFKKNHNQYIKIFSK